ncbi:LPS-assembly lipoprotein LptE [Thermosulfuriphilus sp.]
MWFLSLFLWGCGYHFAGTGSNLPPWIKTICVATWENRSEEPGLGALIASELRNQFERGRKLRLVPADQADVVLNGEIISLESRGLSYQSYAQGVENRLVLRAKARLVSRQDGKIIWANNSLYREETYTAGSQTDKQKILEKMAYDLAEMIYHQIMEYF